MPQTNSPSALRSFVGAPFDSWTYRSLAYLLLAIPLGLLYFVVLTVGASLTLGLSVTLLGPVVLALTLLMVNVLAWGDAKLTGELLATELRPGFPPTDEGFVPFLRELVLGRGTWLGVGFLVWRTLLGFFAMLLLVVAGSVALELLLAPVTYGQELGVHLPGETYPIHTAERAAGAAGAGLLLGLVTLWFVGLLGRASAAIATGLLRVEDADAGFDASDAALDDE